MGKKYECPKIAFEKIQPAESIAKTCWGNHGTNRVMYFDVKNAGWVEFTVAGADACKLDSVADITIVKYHNVNITQQEVYNQLINAGGANGNPWNGNGFSEVGPGPDWSTT
ncbi:hypothetical protein [Terrisporobacter mayombei]|uniref:Uncharacterized protein n=1 Tax=Terrisporobacter mayombei TaxID=1541 RepID=A0ABY9Q786_9FIRM|nr:hypothetical protein [Terrisporobacter mayombei]MCC3869645.1 hypothetical protein [Terrisporobacter mayombei]WMT83416.1 hypothetical protein TEMA_39320 [Terrisporobacter mayombei]